MCSESIVPYMSSILQVLTEHIGAGILGMQNTLKTQMNSSFSLTNGGTDDTQKVRGFFVDSYLKCTQKTPAADSLLEFMSKLFLCVLKVLSGLRSVSLDQNYRQVENLAEKLEDLKQRFGLSSTQRLVHSAQLEIEQV